MKNILLCSLMGVLVLFVACDEDEPKVDPLVGEWELDDAIFSDAPADFSLQNGKSNSLYGEESYIITFYADFTYERELENIPNNIGDVDDEGEWTKTGDELELDPDDEVGLMTSFTIEEDITDRKLVLSTLSEIFVFPDIILETPEALDTIDSQEEFDQLVAEHARNIQVNIELEFDRNN